MEAETPLDHMKMNTGSHKSGRAGICFLDAV